MQLSSFGGLRIEVTPLAENPQVMNVDIAAQNRKEGVNMQTNKDETIDQFTQRMKSMLRALFNTEPRQVVVDKVEHGKVEVKKQAKGWDEMEKPKTGEKVKA